MNAERLYAVLLRLYPKSFRQEYAGDLLAAFRELRAANDRRRRSWRFILADTFHAAALLWWDECRWSLSVRWLMTCVVGLVSTAVVANLVAWVFSYLYHPYLEGFTVSAPAYGALLGVVLGGTTAASQWWLLPRQDGRTWALASAVGLLIALLVCGTVVDRTVMGMNPLAEQAMRDVLGVWIGPANQLDSIELSIALGAMALSAGVFGAATERRMQRPHAA